MRCAAPRLAAHLEHVVLERTCGIAAPDVDESKATPCECLVTGGTRNRVCAMLGSHSQTHSRAKTVEHAHVLHAARMYSDMLHASVSAVQRHIESQRSSGGQLPEIPGSLQ